MARAVGLLAEDMDQAPAEMRAAGNVFSGQI
jgi:hypothetical protein